MKLRYFAVLAALILSVGVRAQTTQPGRVVIQNSDGKTLPGVQVTVYGAPPTDTDGEGRFSLSFVKAVSGDLAPLREAYKKGYELVNKRETERWILSPHEMVIVMAETGTIRQARERYYEIGRSRYLNRYEETVARIEKLEKENRLTREDYAERLEQAYDQFEKSQRLLDEYSDLFARVNRDELSDLERRAFELVDAGRLDEAIALYEDQKLVERLAAESVSKERVETELREMTPSLVRYADICVFAGGAENLARAGEIYLAITQADPSYENLLSYGRFLFVTVDIPASIEWCKKAVDAAPSDPALAEALVQLAMALVVEKNFAPGEEYIARAAELFGKAIEEEPENDYYRQRLVFTHLQSATLHYYSKEPVKALAAAEAAQRENEKLNPADTLIRLRSEASYTGLKMLIALFSRENNIFQADNSLIEADGLRMIELGKRLVAAEDNLENGTMLTSMTVNLGSYYLRTARDYAKAEKYFMEALAAEEKMALKNPMLLKSEIAILYNHLGALSTAQGQMGKALEYYERSATMSEELYALNPNAFGERLSNAYQALALFHRKNGEPEKAINYLIRSTEILDRIPEKYASSVAMYKTNAFFEAGQIFAGEKRPEQAKECFEGALGIINLFPDVDMTNLRAGALNELASLHAGGGENEWLTYAMEYVTIIAKNMNLEVPTAAYAAAQDEFGKGNAAMCENYRTLCLALIYNFIEELDGRPIDLASEREWEHATVTRLLGNSFMEEEEYETADYFFGLYMQMIPRVKLSKENANAIATQIDTLLSRVEASLELENMENVQGFLNELVPYMKYALKNNIAGVTKEDLREIEDTAKEMNQWMKSQ